MCFSQGDDPRSVERRAYAGGVKAPVFVESKKFRALARPTIAADFKALVIDDNDQRYGSGSKAPVSAAE